MDRVTVALWATNLARPLNGILAWAAAVDRQMAETKSEGAAVFAMPEYASEQWLSFAPARLAHEDEIAWMANEAPAALAAVAPLARKHDMALLAGTMPVLDERAPAEGARYVNRAWLCLPDGRVVGYDKLALTPGERNPAGWFLEPGDRVKVVEWRGLRLTPLVCLDIELPALAARLAALDLDLVLVPSMTSFRSGYRRVFDCAKARAVELQAIVCAVGAIGAPAHLAERESNCSGAAAFLPCEVALGETGVAGAMGPWSETEGPGPMLIARDLPVEAVRRSRRGAAEVWPGAWSAEHVIIEDAAGRT